MEEISLYRKYRPHNFDNLVGQDHIKTTLINALRNRNVSHAYLFTGPRGTGKTSTARLIAKGLNCTELHDDHEPCNKCEFCTDINDGRLIDLIEIDAASNRGIDEVRDLKEKINFAPSRSKYKVYIIDEAHMMTKEAFNALLKTLEEPPSHAYFVLATTEIHKIPETIISRCQRFDFKRIGIKTLMTRLSYICQKENIQAADTALEVISKYVDGGLRDAIGLVEQLTTDHTLSLEHVQEILGVSDHSLLTALFNSLVNNDTKDALGIIHDLHGQGSDLKQFVHEFIEMLRQNLLDTIANDQPKTTSQLIRMISLFQDAQQKLESTIPQLALEIAVIQITGAFEEYEPEIVADKPEQDKADSESEPKKKPDNPSVNEVLEVTLNSIRDHWPRIMERIKTPSLKISLRNAIPQKVKDHDLTLTFNTNFHRDKVVEHDHRVELEEVIKTFFNTPVKIVTEVKALEIKPIIEEKVVHETAGNLDDMAELFGGEIVD
ncbi:MAG: DNA polymerase III subunit gamma/tau [bacterium]|nr:DNA polymerase III subunit gamma/tau [bacterium]